MKNIERLRGVIDLFLENSERINSKKEHKYWYPLSMAVYGVDEILEALDSMCSFRTTMWEKTEQFEKMFAQYIGCAEAVMVNSGSSADLILTHLLRKKVGSDSDKNAVIMPAVTWPTQIWSTINAGFDVRLVDIDPITLNICYAELEKAVDDRTAAIFLVHLMGNPCDADRVKSIIGDRDIEILEDCCESLGATICGKHTGNFGFGGSYSFFFSHHMTTMEGGMIVLNSPELAAQARIMRAHGWTRNVEFSGYGDIDPRYTFVDDGFNLRPTELQAAFGLHQLKKLGDFNRKREILSTKFFAYISRKKWVHCPISFGQPSWLGLPIIVKRNAPFSRNEMVRYLESQGIETRPIVAGNLMRHPVASKVKMEIFGTLDGADRIHDCGFYIGLSPMFEEHHIDRLTEIFDAYLRVYGDGEYDIRTTY